ncbi:restriction endonuclease subunit S [Lactobacillus sp. B4026]|uniref:restriction endonuclease subunit S n=1 Tax=Lactobacillus sp. B4026 TaxID=2818035 RepID=UPI00226B886B|nr:restriction endonuclease subunit S [Lactobacillus sp. B4026]MCX8735819.1 restriction endonuclease subunit S [Lactobacillus sp. B4026]
MSEDKLVPSIRFKGFEEEWKTDKLGKVTKYVKGFAFKSKDYTNTGIRIVRVTDLTENKIDELKKDSTFVSLKTAESYQKYRIYKGDIIITTVGSKTELKSSSVGRAIFVSKSVNYLLNQNLVKLSTINKINSPFVYFLLCKPNYSNYISRIERGNANQANIAIDDLWKYKFKIPQFSEQQKIGDLFAKLDRLLDLQQQKLDQLELLKKALLQKLFPKQDEKIPELRFKGFEDEWKTNALQEISKIVGGGTPDTNKADYWNGDINWYSPTEIGKKPFAYSSNKKISKIGLKKSSAKLLPANKTVLFTSRAGIGDMAILKTPAATNQGFQSLELKDNVYPYFVYSYGFEIKRKAKKLASGSTFLEISNKDMKRITLEFPNVKEQQKIGNLLAKIDRLIELENKKFSNLKLVKKSLLQNMFVE